MWPTHTTIRQTYAGDLPGGGSAPPFPSTPYHNGPTTPGDVYVSPGVWSVRAGSDRGHYDKGMRANRSRAALRPWPNKSHTLPLTGKGATPLSELRVRGNAPSNGVVPLGCCGGSPTDTFIPCPSDREEGAYAPSLGRYGYRGTTFPNGPARSCYTVWVGQAAVMPPTNYYSDNYHHQHHSRICEAHGSGHSGHLIHLPSWVLARASRA